MLHQRPDVFLVPSRFAKHVMVVTDLTARDEGPVKSAVELAWRLQKRTDVDCGGELGG